jgi:hypothetical protein
MQFNEFGDKVITLSGTQGQMRYPVIGQIQAYWEALRAGRTVPLRSEVDPRGIEAALEFAFVLERVAPQVARFRLAGMHLNDLMGMEVRGMPLTCFFTPAHRAQVSERLEAVFQTPAIADFALTSEAAAGKPLLKARLLVLPLRSDLGDITRALGCLVADGHAGRSPRRFDVDSFRVTKVEAGRPVNQRMPTVVPVAGFAEGRGPFAPADRPAATGQGGTARSASHLRLVKSDD